ncbi:AarF/ABC1/UbiB kinase family protein [Candidatus Roizmanbacteria bacterium]|nr:AarF/ABC1/UbiB kinase family protein [Candidatus Roizmanbacteria bacterium]
MLRVFHVLLLIGKYAILYCLVGLRVYRQSKSTLLKHFFEEAGGAFIKFGQILALRVDVLTKDQALALMDLFDQVKPFSYREVEQICRQELGTTPDKLFTVFEKTPFASASFAQVHAAKLKNGDVVVVKIQRPGIEETVQADFTIIDILSFFADVFYKIDALPWREFAHEFRLWTTKELNYYIEAENMQKLSESVRKHQVTNVVIPKSYYRLSTKRVLVQEYIDGVPLSRVLQKMRLGTMTAEKLKKMGIDIKQTPRVMVSEILREYFIDGMFHADPHPGNILLLPQGKIGIIDFGIVGVSAPKRRAFINFLHASAWSRYKKDQLPKISRYFLQFAGDSIEQLIGSVLAANVDQKHINGFMEILSHHLCEHIAAIESEVREGLNVMKVDHTAILLQMMKFVQRYRIKLPPSIVVFIRMMSIIGFLAKELDYEFNTSSTVIEFCQKYKDMIVLPDDDGAVRYKRLNQEVAFDRLNNWMMYLVEKDPKLYQVVSSYIAKYTH